MTTWNTIPYFLLVEHELAHHVKAPRHHIYRRPQTCVCLMAAPWLDWPAWFWTSPECSCAPPSTSSHRPCAAPDTPLGPPAIAAFPPSWNPSGRPSGTCSDALNEFTAFTTLSTKTVIYRYYAVLVTVLFTHLHPRRFQRDHLIIRSASRWKYRSFIVKCICCVSDLPTDPLPCDTSTWWESCSRSTSIKEMETTNSYTRTEEFKAALLNVAGSFLL